MTGHKWDAAKIAAWTFPLFLLAAYALGAALPLPARLLPERSYLAFTRGASAAELKAARGRAREAFLVLPDRLFPLPGRDADVAAYEPAARLLPERTNIQAVLADLVAASGDGWKSTPRRARLVMDESPGIDEIAALDAVARRVAWPFSLDLRPRTEASAILGLAYRIAPNDTRRTFELALSSRLRNASSIVVSAGTEAASHVLWRGDGETLPKDLVLRLSAESAALETGIFLAVAGNGMDERRRFDLAVESAERPRVLVISEKSKTLRSFVERLYPADRLSPAEAALRNLRAYELIVIDGLPLKRLEPELRAELLDIARRRTGSILFAADSPDFGRRGDDPELEAILPVALMPRELKNIPDLAILILVDVSGSMFGDKLSLAKVSGLELLRTLKPGDRVGLMLFSDERRWIYRFEPNSEIRAAPILEPLRAKGGTDLAAALDEGLALLAAQERKERHVVVISDGVTKPADFAALADRARSIGATVSAMGIGEEVDRSLLERLASRCKGRYYAVRTPDEVPALLFEDRKSASRPPFAEGNIPILALNGTRIANVGGMAQYAASEPATVLFANEFGDPLFASREYGNRAIMLFASDLYGGYTADFFASVDAAGAIKDRLDALFAEKPLEVSVSENARGPFVLVTSDALVAPRILITREGESPRERSFDRAGAGAWAARIALPNAGRYHAAVIDRGSAIASFPLASNPGLAGIDQGAANAVLRILSRAVFWCHDDRLWLALFFAASLACTIILRVKR